ncbi:MAG: hypothetical protein EA376_01075 [Phycisphaeraceae bacterium]|nr:MAG: hypothetical protein EA376_01075 [Phycisphaeraceae bacterium]
MDDAQHGVVVRIFRESGLLSEYVIVRRVCRELSSGVDERKVAFANRLLDILIEMSEAYVDTTRDSSVMCEELSLIYNARYDAMVQESRQVPIED